MNLKNIGDFNLAELLRKEANRLFPLFLLRDKVDIDSKRQGYVITKSRAINISDQVYDVALGLSDIPLDIEGHYNIELINAGSDNEQHVKSNVLEHFHKDRNPRYLAHTNYQKNPVLFEMQGGKDFVGGIEIKTPDYVIQTADSLKKLGAEGKHIVYKLEKMKERITQSLR